MTVTNKKTCSKKSITLALLITGMQAAAIAPAQADWYVESSIIESDLSDSSLVSTGREVNGTFDSDIGFAGAIGYTHSENSLGALTLEAEYLSTQNDTSTINFNGNDFSGSNVAGSIETQSIFINAIQSFGDGAVIPYVGVGLGYSQVESDIAYNPTLSARINDDDNTFSYQFIAGLNVPFSDNFTGFAEYRYVDFGDVELSRTGGGPGGVATTTQSGDIDLDAFAIGLRYTY